MRVFVILSILSWPVATAAAAVAAVAAVAAGAGGAADVSKMALVTIETAIDIDAPVARVWADLTDASTAPSWCPLWSVPAGTASSASSAGTVDTAGSLSRVGTTLPYRDKYGNVGRSVVVFTDARKELRIAHVPDNGSYLCQITVRLESFGAKTRLLAREQYSDQLDVPIDRDTAASSRDDLVATVAALKKIAESK